MKTSREIVAEAWHLTIEHRAKLFRYGFVPSFFSILVTAMYVYYQVQAFRYSPLFSDGKEHFQIAIARDLLGFTTQSTLVFSLSLFAVIVLLIGWYFAPMLCRAAIVQLVTQARNGEKVERGFSSSLLRFFPIFQISLLKRSLAPFSFLTEFGFVARNLTGGIMLIAPLLFFFGVIGLIFLFFASFTTQVIMLKGEGFAGAIKISFQTVLQNFGQTFKIMLLFLFVELRVILNVLIVLFLPIALVGLTGVFASMASQTVGIVIAGLVLLALIFIAAYLTGILFVFSEAMWTIAFLHFSENQDAVEEQSSLPPTSTAISPQSASEASTDYNVVSYTHI